MSNMFDLEKRPAGKKRTVTKTVEKKSTVISPEEQATLLQGYIQVPYEQWGGIKKYWHIRYERKGGLFRRGGFVHSVWKTTSKSGVEKMFVKLVSKPNDKPNKDTNPYWVLQLGDIEKIWRRVTNREKQATGSSPGEIQELRREIAEIKSKQEQIIALVKRLHGIGA